MHSRVDARALDVLGDAVVERAEDAVAQRELPGDELVVGQALVLHQHDVPGVVVLGVLVQQVGQPALCAGRKKMES